MKITIIGSNSFIARNYIYTLIKEGNHEIFCYDRESDQKDFKLNYTSIDISKKTDIEKINYDVDVIYYFVAITGTHDGFENPSLYIKINEIALVEFISTYIEKKSKAKIVYPSTRLVYDGSNQPLKEDANKKFKTIYAINKYAAEEYLKIYANSYNISFVILRICVPFGSLIPNASSYGTLEFMLNKAKNSENITLYGDGDIKRTFIHISDLCEVFKRCANIKDINPIYNVGGWTYSLNEVATLIAGLYNVEVDYMEWPEKALMIETGDTMFDSTALDNSIDMEYKISINDYITKLQGDE